MALTPLQLWLLGLMTTAKIISASSIAFLHPSSRVRDLVGTTVLGLYFFFYRDTQLLKVEGLRIAVNTFAVIQVGNIIDVLCITRLAFPNAPSSTGTQGHNGEAKKTESSVKSGPFRKFWWALVTIWNFRGVGMPQQVKGIPNFQRCDASFMPGRATFLLRRCVSIAIRMAILKEWGNGWPLLSPAVDLAFPKQYLFSRMQDISSHEILIRIWATGLFWAKGYLNHSVAYDLFSAVAVTSGISQPRSWPPMYGSLVDCHSIRNWWGTTWHQLLRKQLTSISNFALFDIFRLQRRTRLARYATTFLTFWVSGIYHILSDGVEIESGVVRFFLMQAAAITVEDAIQAMYRRSGSPLGAKWGRSFGYIWVCAVLVWTSPGWRYPVLAHRFQHELE